ncbi:AraC family transcriptional regulator [Sphingomonas sp. PP-CC-3G-468]|uniref:AraC family transcriptional regulator n=1 Tax=Sphingomonas sp. PP-CC-3G-468 TaxID=2135656 RepID=UPI00104756FB|nr:AraC family transcriptional regulator [Sphingomonas sp. PP-CC-3G-468]TCM04707.1 AraC family transcriptional regulator [Sphingomonas sp. PP-CC-3G-468]
MDRDRFHVWPSCSGAIVVVDACSARSFARHAHDEFGVGLMTGGAQRSASGRGPVEAVRGNLITVNPAELHDGTPIGPARSWSMLYLPQDIVCAVVADLEEGRRSTRELHAPVVDDPRLARLFMATRQAALHPRGGPAFEERLLLLLAGLFDMGQQRAAPDRRLSQVRERIDDAPARPHGLTELAALAGLSRWQTVRAFARLTGLTPHAYVIQRRLETARTLIRRGSTLADAATEAGFADQSHMHRIFVARHGYTPGAYAGAFRPFRAISFKNAATRSR